MAPSPASCSSSPVARFDVMHLPGAVPYACSCRISPYPAILLPGEDCPRESASVHGLVRSVRKLDALRRNMYRLYYHALYGSSKDLTPYSYSVSPRARTCRFAFVPRYHLCRRSLLSCLPGKCVHSVCVVLSHRFESPAKPIGEAYFSLLLVRKTVLGKIEV